MKKFLKWSVIAALAIIIGYVVSVTIVDAILMGFAKPKFDSALATESYIIADSVRIDPQTDFKCSAFSSAYILRHWGEDAHGDSIYDVIPDKMDDGYVYPKGIIKYLSSRGFTTNYYIADLTTLKNEVSKGHPVIVMIKIRPDKDWLHYVPVVGYSADSIFIAESLPELCNATNPKYNRSIATDDFNGLWNTASFRMPLYRNTLITATR